MNTETPRPDAQQLNLQEYWTTIVKHRKMVGIIFVSIVAVTVIYTLAATPIYRASAQILIERSSPNLMSTQQLLGIDPSGQDFYQTQYKLLESPTLARELVRRMNLGRYPEFRANDEDGTVGAFRRRLKTEPVRMSRLVNIHFESADPKLAALVANNFAQSYMDWNLGMRMRSGQEAAQFLSEQVQDTKRKLEAAEQALQQFREKYGLAVTASASGKGATGAVSDQKVSQINTQLLEAANKRREAEITYRRAASFVQHPDKIESIPEVINNPIIGGIKNLEMQLLRDKTEKSQKYGPKHPVMVAIDTEIENIRKKKIQEIRNIVEGLKGQYEAYLQQEQSLQKALSSGMNESMEQTKLGGQYQILQQEVDSIRSSYDLLLKRLREANVSEENRLINIYLVDRAEVPKGPVKPNARMNLLLAIVLGLSLGVGAAFLIEYLDNTIKTPDDLKQYLNLPYLGSLQHMNWRDTEALHPELEVINNPRSPLSEAYRALRTAILFSTPGHSPKSLLVTSSLSKEGKTITCANLAVAMAHGGQRVLLIDGDMRKPRLHKIFTTNSKEQGISNILVGGADWREVKVKTDVANLDFIPAGPISPNPAELLGSDRMQNLMSEAVSEYDIVLLDSPPVVAATDPVILSRLVEGVILILKSEHTIRNLAANSLRQLRDIHAHILGGVINDVDMTKDNLGNYYYYYQYQAYYGGESADAGTDNTRSIGTVLRNWKEKLTPGKRRRSGRHESKHGRQKTH